MEPQEIVPKWVFEGMCPATVAALKDARLLIARSEQADSGTPKGALRGGMQPEGVVEHEDNGEVRDQLEQPDVIDGDTQQDKTPELARKGSAVRLHKNQEGTMTGYLVSDSEIHYIEKVSPNHNLL